MELDKIAAFFRVSPVYQAMAGALVSLTVSFTQASIENYSRSNDLVGSMGALTAMVGLGGFLSGERLAMERMNEYKKVRNSLDRHGWDEKFIEPKSHSWCQRVMVRAASNDSGFGEETRKYLHDQGYRWYHFLPD